VGLVVALGWKIVLRRIFRLCFRGLVVFFCGDFFCAGFFCRGFFCGGFTVFSDMLWWLGGFSIVLSWLGGFSMVLWYFFAFDGASFAALVFSAFLEVIRD
jgi:VIT1/CCC1 family predicted Fe2+/Mn2+ transporter